MSTDEVKGQGAPPLPSSPPPEVHQDTHLSIDKAFTVFANIISAPANALGVASGTLIGKVISLASDNSQATKHKAIAKSIQNMTLIVNVGLFPAAITSIALSALGKANQKEQSSTGLGSTLKAAYKNANLTSETFVKNALAQLIPREKINISNHDASVWERATRMHTSKALVKINPAIKHALKKPRALDATAVNQRLEENLEAAHNSPSDKKQNKNANFSGAKREEVNWNEKDKLNSREVQWTDSSLYNYPGKCPLFTAATCEGPSKTKSKTNEDIFDTYPIGQEGYTFAVFDGHGGDKTKEYLHHELLRTVADNIANLPEKSDQAIYNAINSAFITVNQNWLESESRLKTFDGHIDDLGAQCGSTACVAVLINGNLWVANTGDTRAILIDGDEVSQLSQDAEPSSEKFGKLVAEHGGQVAGNKVLANRLNPDGTWIANTANGVSVAQAFGDFAIPGITVDPQITRIPLKDLKSDNPMLIMATDGLFSVATNNEVKDSIHEERSRPGFGPRFYNPAHTLVTKARNTMKEVEGQEKRANFDDVTVVQVSLGNYFS